MKKAPQMKKWIGFLLALAFASFPGSAQIDWKNYSTSFQGNGKEGGQPVLVTATPYNGIYLAEMDFRSEPGDPPPPRDIDEEGNKRPVFYRTTNNIDSSEEYFVVPGIHPANADLYEFRVLQDDRISIHPWGPIEHFTGPGMRLNEFKEDFAFLGGYKTDWRHYVMVDVREKESKKIVASAAVYWRPARAGVQDVYTSRELKDFLKNERSSYDRQPGNDSAHQWRGKLLLEPDDNSLIFHVNADIFKKEALEYQLMRNGMADIPWRANDFNNNLLLLQNLPPGEYVLQIRLRAQRHNVTAYPFFIKTAWHQTLLFKGIAIGLTLLSFVTLVLLAKVLRQRRKIRVEEANREKLNFELRSIRSQLNPHFIFNSLNSIQGLINKNEIAAANLYLSEFGNLLRDTLSVSDKDFTDLGREIGVLDTYLRLEQLRYGFRYEIHTDENVPIAETEIPAVLLQPLVENAVKHGVAGQQEKGSIRVLFSRENANFIVLIKDSGQHWMPGGETTGYGLKITRERIRVLNQLSKDSTIFLTITVESGSGMTIAEPGSGMTIAEPGSGTTVKLLFQNWYT
jgi:two-component system LytT family sensor kinase